jgi:hypothetical protein
MFDLNGGEFQEKEVKGIFNGGVAGKTDGVTISGIDKKQVDDAPGGPDYKIYVSDADGHVVNVGFWKAPKNEKIEVQRALHIARAVLGRDYKFPSVNSCAEAIDMLMKLIKQNMAGKTFNVFTTYGNVDYPSQYLGLRYFDFIENAETAGTNTKLFKKKNDLLEKITEDNIVDSTKASTSTTSDDSDLDSDDWV